MSTAPQLTMTWADLTLLARGWKKAVVVQFPTPPVPARKRGKMQSRRRGQFPKVRIRKRADGTKYYFFQYWIDVPGVEDRKRMTEVVGLVGQMTKSEAERRRTDFIQKLAVNSCDYHIPSSHKFSDAVEYYRTEFGPMMHRPSTLSTWNGRIKKHLEPDWKDCPLELITIQAVNDWAWKKRQAGLSWVVISSADHAACSFSVPEEYPSAVLSERSQSTGAR